MSITLSLEALQADRQFVQRQIEECPPDAWTTRLMWEDRLEDIDEQIAALEGAPSDLASVAVIFDGLPVIGARDIRLGFAVDALDAYQAMISTAFAARLPGDLHDRGTLRGLDRSRLFINDLARGSVGFILEELVDQQYELLPTVLKEVVEESTDLLSSLAQQDDDDFAAFIATQHPRVVAAVQQFAKVLSDARASARIIGGQHEVFLSVEGVGELATRLREVQVTDETVQVNGILLGVLPESQRFELRPLEEGADVIVGPASHDLVQKYLNDDAFVRQTVKKPVRAQITRTTTFRNARQVREHSVLEYVEPLEGGDAPTPLLLPGTTPPASTSNS
jgi:hypothetical protein